MIGWIIFEIAVNLFEATLIVYFFKKQLTVVRKSFIMDTVCILCIVGWLTLYLFFDVPVVDTVVFIFPLLYGCIVFSDKWYIIFLWDIVIALIFVGVATLSSSFYIGILKADWEQMMRETPLRMAFVVSGNLLVLIIVIIVTKLTNRNEQLPWYTFTLLLTLNILCLVSIEFLFSMRLDGNTGEYFTGACLCLFAISALSIILYEVLSESARRQQKYKLDNERLKLTHKYNQEMQSMYTDIAIFRHDIKHQMQIIAQMVSARDAVDVQNYIDALNERVSTLHPFATGNIAVDALLTTKASIMRHRQIVFDFQPYPLNDLPIEENDFCALLGNLLDNAIEGIERLSDSSGSCVTLTFARTWDMFYIICQNPYNPKTVRRIRGLFASSKEDASHGLGTRSIEATVRRANGTVHFRLNNDAFCVQVVLPFREKGEIIND